MQADTSDKHAFFALLDEYFESRPHLRPAAGGSNGGGITLNAGHAKAAAAAFTAATATQSGRGAPSGPPVVPSRTYRAEESEAVAEPAPPAWSPAAHSPTASGQSPSKPSPMVSAKGYMSSGMNKMSNNDTLNKGLGKIGAGNFTSRMSDRFSASSGPYVAPRSTPREPSAESGAGGAAPTPPPSRTAPPARGGPVAGLQSSKVSGYTSESALTLYSRLVTSTLVLAGRHSRACGAIPTRSRLPRPTHGWHLPSACPRSTCRLRPGGSVLAPEPRLVPRPPSLLPLLGKARRKLFTITLHRYVLHAVAMADA